ncbi:MAG: dienelactone hydrolase family protein [Ferruginibacter sp.]|nr:dienelactone hydrolase family protein [Ferruginibacter sp.]
MFKKLFTFGTLGILLFSVASCNTNATSDESKKTSTDTTTTAKPASIKAESIDYTGDGVTMKGFVAYNDALSSLRPVVIIVPEWWGICDYTKDRAKQLAALGYLAFAVDFYGEGKTAETPDQAGKLARPFYAPGSNLAQKRFEAALAKIKTYPQADTANIAAIGYCFGGAMVLNMAKIGEPLKGVVSFHGNLVGVPVNKELLKAAILVCHGEIDQFVPAAEVATFKKQMDSIGANYTFKSHANATHAFTNPMADEKAKKYSMPIAYNAAADTASFNEMKMFFNKIFK